MPSSNDVQLIVDPGAPILFDVIVSPPVAVDVVASDPVVVEIVTPGPPGPQGPPGSGEGGGVTDEQIDDRVAQLLQPGSNITLDYDDVANTLTINSTATGGGGGDVTQAYVDAQDALRVLKAGDTMSGHLTLPTGPASANAVRKDYVDAAVLPKADKTYVDTQDALKVAKLGDTMTGHLGLPTGPAAGQATRKDYVDAADALKADKTYVDTQDATKQATAQKGQPNGYASLDASAKVPAAQLPAFVDDVQEFANLAAFPATGSTGIIYVALDTNKVYRWSGSVYVEISPSPGSTDAVPEGSLNLYFTTGRAAGAAPVQSVAGRTGAVTLAKADVGLGNVDNTSDANKPVSTAQAAAISSGDATRQPIDPTLTALAGLDASAGLLEQSGADTFTKRALGVASANSVPTRGDADARYAATAALDAKVAKAGDTMTGDLTITKALPGLVLNLTDPTGGAAQINLNENGVQKGLLDYVGSTFPAVGNRIRFGSLVAAPISILTNGSDRVWIDPTGLVGIGTTAPTAKLTVSLNAAPLPAAQQNSILHIANSDGNAARILVDVFSTGGQGHLSFRHAQGTAAAPTATGNNQAIGGMTAFGRGATGYSAGARASFDLITTQAWTDTAQGAAIRFNTTSNDTTSTQERLRIDHNGNVGIGTSSPSILAGGNKTLTIFSSFQQAVLELATSAADVDGLTLGHISFCATTALGAPTQGAAIFANLTGATAGNRGTSIQFWTKSNGGGIHNSVSINPNGQLDVVGVVVAPGLWASGSTPSINLQATGASQQAALNFFTVGGVTKWQCGKNSDESFFLYDNTAAAYAFNVYTGSKTVLFNYGTASTSKTTGAVTVNGGVGINGSLYTAEIYIENSHASLVIDAAASTAASITYRIGGATKNVVYNNGSGAFVITTNAAFTTGVYMADGTNTWVALSDARLPYKRTARDITDELPPLRDFKLYERTDGEGVEIFTKAQEVEPLFPHIVKRGSDDDTYTPSRLDDPNAWGIAYDRFGVIALAYSKQQARQIAELQAELSAIKGRLH